MTPLSALSERLQYLLLADGAPARCKGDLLDEVVQLRSELDRMQQFLESSDATNNNNMILKKQVMQLAYEIEDAVESYALKEISSSSSKGKSSLVRLLFRGSTTTTTTRSFQKDLNNFKRRISDLNSHHIIDTAGGEGTSMVQRPGINNYIGFRRTKLHGQLETTSETRANSNIIVGMEEDVTLLRDRLLGQGSKLSIIAICGGRGMGKTTLAKLLYDDPWLVSHFGRRAWANVGQEFQVRDTLGKILFSMSTGRVTKEEMRGMETMQLMECVYKMIKGIRYLIVLDDVWSREAWDMSIKNVFPDDHIGSRIVITTHSRYVAEQITRSPIHEMRMLNEQQSWEHFRLKSGLNDLGDQLNPETEKIGKQVVSQCKGNPLAITLIGNMLRVKEPWFRYMVLKELKDNPNLGGIEEIMELIYEQLPFHLKPCFLYLGHLPPNQDVPVDKLYSMWMAEGLISSEDVNNNCSRMEVAETYLNELVDRDVGIGVQMEDVPIYGKFKSCRLHDLRRGHCLLKLRQEGFFELIDFGPANEITSLTSRVAIYLNKYKTRDDAHLINIPKSNNNIRSIHFFDIEESQAKPVTWPVEFSDLEKFQWTRVLDFNGIDFRFENIPRGIETLVLLRYLSFHGCYLRMLPSYLRNFRLLETLDLRVSCLMTIPNVLRKLSMLRHLYFPLAYQSDQRGKMKLHGLINLEILENFHTGICDADDLLQLKKVQIFTCTVDGNDMDLKKVIDFLNSGKILHSSLVARKFDCYSTRRRTIVAELFKCNALHSLDIEGHLGDHHLLNRETIGSHFTRMVFNGSELNVDPMPILGKLTKLKSLVLCNNAFAGNTMVCCQFGFPQLTSLGLVKLPNLVEWDVEAVALRKLTNLTVEQCNNLRMLPNELKRITSLRKLMIRRMPKEFRDQVKRTFKFWHGMLDVTYYDS